MPAQLPPRRVFLALTAVGAIFATAATALGQAADPPPLRLLSVKVVTANTVDATFSNPLSTSNTQLSARIFHAPHYDWDIPHSHDATSVELIDGAKTARVTLGRNLHSDPPPCDGIEPRCSDDELPFVVRKATDVYGQVLSNSDWEVWAIGSER